MQHDKMKKIAYVFFSVIFLAVSGAIATKIIKGEIEKGQMNREKPAGRTGKESAENEKMENLAAAAEVESKEDADKALNDMDSLVEAMENGLEE